MTDGEWARLKPWLIALMKATEAAGANPSIKTYSLLISRLDATVGVLEHIKPGGIFDESRKWKAMPLAELWQYGAENAASTQFSGEVWGELVRASGGDVTETYQGGKY